MKRLAILSNDADLRLAADKLTALANIIERPPLDDVLLKQSLALDTVAAIRTVVAAVAQQRAAVGDDDVWAIYQRAQTESGFSPSRRMGGLSEKLILHAIRLALQSPPAHGGQAR